MDYGFLRIACASPAIKLADCASNADSLARAVQKGEKDGAECMVFPELSLTGCTCANLFLQESLLRKVPEALASLARKTEHTRVLFAVGAPLLYKGFLTNCAVFIKSGRILAAIPKTFTGLTNGGIPQGGEARYFQSALSVEPGAVIGIGKQSAARSGALCGEPRDVPFGTDILIKMNKAVRRSDGSDLTVYIGAQIGADVYAVKNAAQTPALSLVREGAHVVLNLAAEAEGAGKAKKRRSFIAVQSENPPCAYAYANAGRGESTTDYVFSAHNIIAENGSVLAESDLYTDGYIVRDIDIESIEAERRQKTAAGIFSAKSFRIIEAAEQKVSGTGTSSRKTAAAKPHPVTLLRAIPKTPFVPETQKACEKRCKEVAAIQAHGLASRLEHTGIKSAVIGLSGGLDSTLALLTAIASFKILSLPLTSITAVSMPGFGTSGRTKNNAALLASLTGVTFKEIDIREAVKIHLKDIDCDENVHDTVYENAQARERTQILMDLANKNKALVIGTGDLSETALGWMTYGGDHLSMYAVNVSVPKTLIQALVRHHAEPENATFFCADKTRAAELSAALLDIVNTPVSPELLPAKNGAIAQKTEELLGPYELHDFFLYYAVRRAFSPAKILFLAQHAFGKKYERSKILDTLIIFYRRFFSQQFKRSCMSDGVSTGSVSLSPRGAWNMPSDASSAQWLSEAEKLKTKKQTEPNKNVRT
ncbi:NAD+ synthetase [Treponema maltophilum ATCC 51939]|uniref:Glutamine-dependent NAD(+) synthetase n=1 Tax=Treponema maltophilum ATCC 51939 TaxID=1125699 RepID=S3KFE7_TREMA|nr:NAD(+) synthase [Treponema maltophilum]EPF30952.1 NAD+ synthetase [Treponema maltophilum ATCC 51939]